MPSRNDTVSSQVKLAVGFCVTFWPVNASLACAPCRSITRKYQLVHTKMLLRTRFWKEYQWMTQELAISWSFLFPQTTDAAKILNLGHHEYQVFVIIPTNILNCYNNKWKPCLFAETGQLPVLVSETAMKLTQAQSTNNGALPSRVETFQETTSSFKGKRNENFLPPPDAPLIYLLNEQIGHRNTFSKVHWSQFTEAE